MEPRPVAGCSNAASLASLVVAGLVALGLMSQAAAAPPPSSSKGAGDVYSCVNGNSVLKSDHEIADCPGAQTRTSRAGVVTRLLSSEQMRVQQECETRKTDSILDWRKRERSDNNLREKYPDVASLRRARDEDLSPARASVERSRARLGELDRERERLARDREFYPKGPVPADLQRRIDQNDALVAAQTQVLKKSQEDVARVAANFDELEATMKRLWVSRPTQMPTMDCSAETLFDRSVSPSPRRR